VFIFTDVVVLDFALRSTVGTALSDLPCLDAGIKRAF
jgi:hypothetical protein